jgi:hypothetical protein
MKANRYCVTLRLTELESRSGPTSLWVLGVNGINALEPVAVGPQSPQPLNGLTGSGVPLAQIEPGRPGGGNDFYSHPNVVPAGVFDVDQPGKNQPDLVLYGNAHSTMVASAIIGQKLDANDPFSYGAARNAQLFSAATWKDAQPAVFDAREADLVLKQKVNIDTALSMIEFEFNTKAIANLATAKHPVAYNLSFAPAIYKDPNAKQATVIPIDGSSNYALMSDYFSNQYNTLMVAAGPNLQPALPDPKVDVPKRQFTTAYDGIDVGRLSQSPNGTYDLVAGIAPTTQAEQNAGARPLVDLVAPGTDIRVADYTSVSLPAGFTLTVPSTGVALGTSFATPLVTSAVALLTEYMQKNPAYFIVPNAAASPDHKLLKAILLNSADVLKGELPGPNGTQPMARTVYGLDGKSDWTDYGLVVDQYAQNASLTLRRQQTPLNPEFGAGALNVARALVQLQGQQGGYQNPQTQAGNRGAIGWDTSALLDPANWPQNLPPYPTQLVKNDPASAQAYVVRKYQNLVPLQPGSYFEATLVGDRPVTMQTAQGVPTNTYTPGNTFTSAYAKSPPNLNLYLMPAGATSLSQAIWSSTATNMAVQHFFFKLPDKNTTTPDGRKLFSQAGYELWATTTAVTQTIPYALAWWGVQDPNPKGDGQGNSGSINGIAWNDTNSDGLENNSESGLASVNVNLLDANNNVVASTTTDYMGNYEFDVPNGTYRVQFTSPAADTFTIPNASDAAGDNNSQAIQDPNNPSLGTTGTITVSGNDVENVDAGFVSVPLGTVGGQVWNDPNGTGVQPPPSAGAGHAGVTVDLFGTDGTPYGSTTTDANGNYSFTGVAPGQYEVEVEKPVNTVFSPTGNGSDSDVDPTTGLTQLFTLASGGSVAENAGLQNVAGSVTGVVFEDDNQNGIQDSGEDGIPDQTVSLLDANNNVVSTTTTQSDGSFEFDGVVPGSYKVQTTPDVEWQLPSGSSPQPVTVVAGATSSVNVPLDVTANTGMISGVVWDDMNGNGIRTANDSGISGLTVQLVNDSTQTVIASTTTASDGSYAFPWIAPGTYDVRVLTTHQGSPMQQGTDPTLYSDFNPVTHIASGIQVGSWQSVENINAGLLNNLPIANNDSAATMQGTPATILVLANDTDPDGDTLFIQSTTQPSNGTVSIVNGTVVYTPNANFTGTDSFQYTISDGYGGTATATVEVTVLSNMLPPPPPPPPGMGSVTGFVWNDLNDNGIDDPGEGMFGTSLRVNLLDMNGNVVATTWTMAGMYSFSGIANGQYRIQIILPSGYTFSPEYQGSSSNSSDVDANGDSAALTVNGMTSFSINAGVHAV